MNQTKKTVLLAALLVLLFVGAAAGYNALSKSYAPPAEGGALQRPTETEPPASAESAATETDEPPTAETEPPLEPAPDFTVKNTAGETVRLSDFVGKPVIINFWATWCSPCKSELPAFDEVAAAYGDRVAFLLVNLTDNGTETVPKVTQFVAEAGYTFPLYFDTVADAASTYGVYSIPLTVFVDAKGNLLGGHSGAMSKDTLAQYVDILLTYYAEP